MNEATMFERFKAWLASQAPTPEAPTPAPTPAPSNGMDYPGGDQPTTCGGGATPGCGGTFLRVGGTRHQCLACRTDKRRHVMRKGQRLKAQAPAPTPAPAPVQTAAPTPVQTAVGLSAEESTKLAELLRKVEAARAGAPVQAPAASTGDAVVEAAQRAHALDPYGPRPCLNCGTVYIPTAGPSAKRQKYCGRDCSYAVDQASKRKAHPEHGRSVMLRAVKLGAAAAAAAIFGS